MATEIQKSKDNSQETLSQEENLDESETKESYGCEHYQRNCQFLTPCCEKKYVCRFCHDEKENHSLNRKIVTQIECLKCCTIQDIQRECCQCRVVFGNYYCSICKLFDDRDKHQYHCDGCGICRIGGRENFFHCEKCDMCLPNRCLNNHKCVEKVSHSNCPICLEDLHTSRIGCHVPPCGHLIHRNCFNKLFFSKIYACPLCAISMVDMSQVWQHLDNEIQRTPMPLCYANKRVWILCRDCHKESRVNFHVVGLKCQSCGSYNTCRTNKPENAVEETEESEEEENGEIRFSDGESSDGPTENVTTEDHEVSESSNDEEPSGASATSSKD